MMPSAKKGCGKNRMCPLLFKKISQGYLLIQDTSLFLLAKTFILASIKGLILMGKILNNVISQRSGETNILYQGEG